MSTRAAPLPGPAALRAAPHRNTRGTVAAAGELLCGVGETGGCCPVASAAEAGGAINFRDPGVGAVPAGCERGGWREGHGSGTSEAAVAGVGGSVVLQAPRKDFQGVGLGSGDAGSRSR